MRTRKQNTTLIFFSFLLLASLVPAQEVLQEVMVNPGDTMWNIANKYLKDPQKWPEIVKVNNFPTADPTIALPGSKIKIPVALIKDEFRTAKLISMVADVRYKRRIDADFKPARADMTLQYEDSLRTMKGSQARVKFQSKEVVQINENSYIILKPEKLMQEVELLQGDIRASRAKVIMPGGTVVNPRGNNSEYQAKIREDESEVVFVYKGEVNVTAKGKTVRVKEGFGTQVLKSAAPLEPMPLSSFKDYDPSNMKTVAPKKIPTQTSSKPLTFTPPPPSPQNTDTNTGKSKSLVSKNLIGNYHIQISKDEKFQSVLVDKTASTNDPFDIKAQSIPDGNYFMRVAFLDALGMQGAYSVPSIITKDTSPPKILNVQPAENTLVTGREATCDVSGDAKDAVIVSVNGEVVFLSSNGHFSTVAYLKEGINKIKIIARDPNGNETVVVKQVTYTK